MTTAEATIMTPEASLKAARLARTRFLLGKTSHAAFFGCLAMRLTLAVDEKLDTAATDGKRLVLGVKWWLSLTDAERIGVVAHEVLHCAMGHHARRGTREPQLWNVGCDLAINPIVARCSLSLPKDVLMPGRPVPKPQQGEWSWLSAAIAKLPPDLSAEEYYRRLAEAKEQAQQEQQQDEQQSTDHDESTDQGDSKSGSTDPEDGSKEDDGDDAGGEQGGAGDDADDGGAEQNGDGGESGGDADRDDDGAEGAGGDNSGEPGDEQAAGSPDIGGCGKVLDAPGDETALKEAKDEWDIAAMEAAERAMGRGDLPAGLREIVERARTPKARWEDLLREFILRNTQDDYSWRRPSRRHIGRGMYLPTLDSDGLPLVAISVDTSGSISRAMAEEFLDHVRAVLDAKPARLVLLYHTSEVYARVDWTPMDGDLEPVRHRTGGTSHLPVFYELDRLDEVPACVVCLTDLDTCIPQNTPEYPVLWAVPESSAGKVVPFGVVLPVVEG